MSDNIYFVSVNGYASIYLNYHAYRTFVPKSRNDIICIMSFLFFI